MALLVQCLFLILALKYLLYLEEIMQLRLGYGAFFKCHSAKWY